MNKILCKIGIHRWQYMYSYIVAGNRQDNYKCTKCSKNKTKDVDWLNEWRLWE